MDRSYLIEVYSVGFGFEGSEAIPLHDPVTDQPVATALEPEWIRGRKSAPAAYVRGARPRVEVVFFMNQATGNGSYTLGGTYYVGAVGSGGGVAEQKVELAWNDATRHGPRAGMTEPFVFELAAPLPDAIGRHVIRLSWYLKRTGDPGAQRFALGDTEHVVCTTWRPLVVDEDEELPPWIYTTIVEWTSTWAAGCDDEKAICDAIVQNLWATGLQYGVSGWSVRFMLLAGGGMCGGWYRMFQAMAASQGVFVHRRFMAVEWRSGFLGKPEQEGWCAIVVREGGQNQLAPPGQLAWYHDHDGPFPLDRPVPVAAVPESRYEFWGYPGSHNDGHCINFLEHGGALYLYDPSFGLGPIELDMKLPPRDWQKLGGAALASLKARYLDPHVPYMLGTLHDGDKLFETIIWQKGASHESPGSVPIPVNGLTVKTASIPDQITPDVPGVSFYWGP
jgi:hypothetical protein